MKYFVDTEFVYTAKYNKASVHPISIGLVAEDGRELYLVDYGFQFPDDIRTRLFIGEHVLPVIRSVNPTPAFQPSPSRWQEIIEQFVGKEKPEFWGDYAAFDYVVLATVMGGFERWPQGWPMYINDLQQIDVAVATSEIPHNALSDARAVRDAFMMQQPEPSDQPDS